MTIPGDVHGKEFGGIKGAAAISLLVVYFSYFFAIGCSEHGCPPLPVDRFFSRGFTKYAKLQGWLDLWDTQATLVYAGWYSYCVLCWAVLPGKWVQGTQLRDGKRLSYKMNAFSTFLFTVFLLVLLLVSRGAQSLTYIYDHWVGLVTAALLNSTIQALYVHVMSYQKGKMLALGGNSDSHLYNWFIGRELNPRIGSFDIKSFNELRPGMILWFIIDIAMACKQYTEIGRVTDSMIIVVISHSLYIVDSLYNEPAVLTTMDIITDGFGFMLSAGDMLWVPFTYSLQARYLAGHPKDLGLLGLLAILGVKFCGYYIFRVSNLEKNNFRNGKNPKHLEYIETERGTRLLISGWWGVSRHPNYLGDWLMAWSWCLPTGFDTPVTYYYVIYFAVLLVHRQMRDDEACRKKYGKDWAKVAGSIKNFKVPLEFLQVD